MTYTDIDKQDWKKQFNDEYGGAFLRGVGRLVVKQMVEHDDGRPDEFVHYTTNEIILFIDSLLHSELNRQKIDIYNFLLDKQEFVTYKKDGGHGIAVPMAVIQSIQEEKV